MEALIPMKPHALSIFANARPKSMAFEADAQSKARRQRC